ncbi:helical backbone metal receptor [Pontibacter sp. G13]|uniref:ABC transporter substrate-binding protein n=1 Tax=Pontibacter sp. G13 TaxID=3074898 RepID=UPI00288A5ED2|nr:helical backbone metal receptor [Pontibacter sp. G13]WNJ17412.1 helical backbone metal receptor [Pontibacter sp. G13]
MKRIAWILLCLFWVGCESQEARKKIENAPSISEQYQDDTGRKVKLDTEAQRIVSLTPNITEMVFAVGGGDKLVGRSQACNYPEAALELPEIPTYPPPPDLEAIAALNPDLLLATDEIFSPEVIQHLKQLGVPMYVQKYKEFGDIFRGMRDLGEILGHPEQGARVSDSLESLCNRITDSTANKVHYGTMILISADPLLVAGGAGFLNDMIRRAGGNNVFGAIKTPYHETTVEEILSLKPEVLILPAFRDQVYAELIATYPALYNTPADVNKRVHVVNPDLFYRPGPRTVEGLLELTQILHSGLTINSFVDAQP